MRDDDKVIRAAGDPSRLPLYSSSTCWTYATITAAIPEFIRCWLPLSLLLLLLLLLPVAALIAGGGAAFAGAVKVTQPENPHQWFSPH